MPTPITHAVVAAVAARAFGEQDKPRRLWVTAIIVSVLPDADVIGFSLGVRYEDVLGHRGFFHSLFFSLLVGSFCVLVFFRDHRPFCRKWLTYLALLFLLGASHGVLDAFTDGGLGIALLAPFDNTRYFMPWTPIPVAPIGLRYFFTSWGLRVIVFEAVYMWLPLLIALAGFLAARRSLRRRREGDDRA